MIYDVVVKGGMAIHGDAMCVDCWIGRQRVGVVEEWRRWIQSHRLSLRIGGCLIFTFVFSAMCKCEATKK